MWAVLCVGWGWVGRHFTSHWGVRTEHFVKFPRAKGQVASVTSTALEGVLRYTRVLVRVVPEAVVVNVTLEERSQGLLAGLPQLTFPVWLWTIQVLSLCCYSYDH